MDTLLASIPDACRALSVGRSKFYDLVSEGRIETVRIGRRRLVRIASLHALANGEGPEHDG